MKLPEQTNTPIITERERMEKKQPKQQRRSENVKLRELVCGDTVHVRYYLYGQVKWAPGTVVSRLGLLTYLIQVHGKRRYVHIDPIRSTSEVDEYFIRVPNITISQYTFSYTKQCAKSYIHTNK